MPLTDLREIHNISQTTLIKIRKRLIAEGYEVKPYWQEPFKPKKVDKPITGEKVKDSTYRTLTLEPSKPYARAIAALGRRYRYCVNAGDTVDGKPIRIYKMIELAGIAV
jgi:hypothetical protein